ncbi:Uma2 family endonuclease [Leptolyngbyaceae cyanobacterium UHCC 1019]
MVAPAQTTQIPSAPAPSEVFYPDCDGQPMANNTEHFEIIVLFKSNLEMLFAADPNVFIAGDLFWYPIEGNNTVSCAPDVMVAVGRPKGRRSSYKQWEENHQPPQVVFEILSPSNTPQEMSQKLLFFDHHGVEEYYIYNPATNELQVWLRGDLGLEWVALEQEWISPRLGIRFDLTQADLTIYRPDGQRFLTFVELEQRAEQEYQRAEQESQRAEQESQRAEQESQRAEQESQRAEQESQRAERLATRLRELGENPDLL